jgi:hypothetical protein
MNPDISGGDGTAESSAMSGRKLSPSSGRKNSAFSKKSLRPSVFQQLEKQSSGAVMKRQSRSFEISGHYLNYYEKKEARSEQAVKGAVKGAFDLNHIREVSAAATIITIEVNDGSAVKLRGASEEMVRLWVAEIKQVVGDLKATAVDSESAPAPGIIRGAEQQDAGNGTSHDATPPEPPGSTDTADNKLRTWFITHAKLSERALKKALELCEEEYIETVDTLICLFRKGKLAQIFPYEGLRDGIQGALERGDVGVGLATQMGGGAEGKEDTDVDSACTRDGNKAQWNRPC